MKIGIIAGSTRDNRLGERVFKWVLANAEMMDDWELELLDLKELSLPLYHDERQPFEMNGDYP
ncbi:MAG TPA: NAD(P)H-dependent oxidoreductase, partial [Candidatus Saccharimonadales bacterium]|nr:NAD(P)H-dependent oxidoreductase [Candidatus Saccharimonadales bacterium]